MFLPIGTSLRISALILLPVLLLSCNALDAGAQNETTDSLSQVLSRANETSSTGNNNGSTPILFEATSRSEGDKGLNQSSFKAQISWTPNAIGSENTFGIKFLNSSSGEELQDVMYDVMLFNEGNHLSESHRSDQQAASQRYIFPEPGFYTLRIDNIGNTTASIDLPMQVIPEFSGAASATALTAGLLATILFIVRFKIGCALRFFRVGDLR
jgi:hypothetical protein